MSDLRGKWKDGLPPKEAVKKRDKQLWMITDEKHFGRPMIVKLHHKSPTYLNEEMLVNPKHWPVDENGDRVEY